MVFLTHLFSYAHRHDKHWPGEPVQVVAVPQGLWLAQHLSAIHEPLAVGEVREFLLILIFIYIYLLRSEKYANLYHVSAYSDLLLYTYCYRRSTQMRVFVLVIFSSFY